MADNQSNLNNNFNQANIGLVTDLGVNNMKPGMITDALNAVVMSFDGQGIQYSNEQGSIPCFVPPNGYVVINSKNVTQLEQVYYFLVNPTTNHSMVGYVSNGSCTFIPLLDDTFPGSDLLNFNINYPILKVIVKTTNCSTQLYFTDNYNNRRYLDLNNLPWKEVTGVPIVGSIDANALLVQPTFNIPSIEATKIDIGGNIVEGCYQFAMQYANVDGDGLTGFYSVTNPVRVFLDHTISPNFNEITNKSINVIISGLDLTGLYSYFNLVVVKTINKALAGVDLVGTYPIMSSNTYTHVYTGVEQSNANIKIDITDVLEKYEYYDYAENITAVDDVLVFSGLTKEEDDSYQLIWNDVNVYWGTSQMPTGPNLGYHDGTVCANYTSYHRDEVYALEGCLVLDNGRELARGHIPGRVATLFDLEPVPVNGDTNAIVAGTCPTPTLPRWQVYNTGSVIGSLSGTADPCTGIKPYQYGYMSYWESTELYPNKPAQWGALSNTPIRHHKFPDSLVTHLHDNIDLTLLGTDFYNNAFPNVYPIGFYIDINSLWNSIQLTTSITPEQKSHIVGFKIMRSDRGANRTIIASGIFNNCGMYTKDSFTYYYPNYPFNDLHADPFISSAPVSDKSGNNSETWLNAFQDTRYTFHSPDTHFNQPSGIEQSFVKLETAEYGNCKAHFVQVLDNAGEKLRTKEDLEIALAGGVASMIGYKMDLNIGDVFGVDTGLAFNPQNFFPSFQAVLDIIDKLIPYTNYAWQYNGVGYYGNYVTVPNDVGNKIRYIEFGGYITPGLNSSLGDDHGINNTFRESSVYVSLNESLPPTQTVGALEDNSRVTAYQLGLSGKTTPFFRNVSSYYGSIKRSLPGQYGEIFSYDPIDTGNYFTFFDQNGIQLTSLPIIYGGDTFINEFDFKIKQAFFLKNTVGLPDGTDIDYNQNVQLDSVTGATIYESGTGNIGYPIWYYSTMNEVFNINNDSINSAVATFITNFPAWYNILLGGLPTIISSIDVIFALINNGLLTSLGIKITNLENYDGNGLYETGQAYLYAYGIVRFFVESEVNVDMRQGYNDKEGNFYPNVASDIPDQWLQQINVPIAYDNTYTYNDTFSKQNRETYFETLRPDWEPNQVCYINYNNRAIWSDKSDLEETKNNWLVYRPANMKDFPKDYGSLMAMDTLENKQVLVRFENRSQVYNAFTTIATTGLTASVGTGDLFSGVPLDLTNTDNGKFGTQNKFILNTEEGHVIIDAKRGQIGLLRGTSIEELSGPKYLNSIWFTNNLPFNILDTFPTFNIDNNYNGIGLTGVYDSYYRRLIITKIDYAVTNNNLLYNGTEFYISNVEDQKESTVIQLGDPDYFCNKSWTMSFSFITNSWVSWHSYQPNYYVEYEDYFQSGLNGTTPTVYTHNKTFSLFSSFFGTNYPYTIEYPFISKPQDQIVQSIKDYTTVYQYTSFDQFVEPDETLYFNHAIIYSSQQCSGILSLVPKINNNLQQLVQYPQYNVTNTAILVTKSDGFYFFNQIWDKVISPSVNIWKDSCSTNRSDKFLNTANIDYSVRSFKKYPIRAKECKVKLILDNNNNIKLISKFIIQQTQNSIK